MAKRKMPNISARFGSRYGSTLRKRWNIIMIKKTMRYECPQCMHKKLEWISVGVWRCRKCGFKIAGGAYEPFLSRKIR